MRGHWILTLIRTVMEVEIFLELHLLRETLLEVCVLLLLREREVFLVVVVLLLHLIPLLIWVCLPVVRMVVPVFLSRDMWLVRGSNTPNAFLAIRLIGCELVY